MTTKGYILETSLRAYRAIEDLMLAIPVFVRDLRIADDYITLEITARCEDLVSVERRLAPYV